MRLALFLSRGMSLSGWDSVGLLERELALYRRLSAKGVEVGIISYGGANEARFAAKLGSITLLHNRFNLPTRLYELLLPILHFFWLRGANLFKTNQTSCGHAALLAANFFAKPLIARCGFMHSEFEARKHGPGSHVAHEALQLEARLFPAASRIVVTSEDMKSTILNKLDLPQQKITVIPNYVDTDVFCPKPADVPRGGLLFVGRLAEQKNVEALIDAIEPLDCTLTLVGDGGLRNQVDSWKQRLQHRLEWIPRIDNAELPALMNRARLFVLPSHFEGHPKTLIEAMSCGMTVLGSDAPGIRNVISHGRNGWLCATDSIAIREAISHLLADSKLARRLGDEARALALGNYSLETIADREFELYRETAGSGRQK